MNQKSKTDEVVEAYNDDEENKTFDVFGSYTGNSQDGEKPVQDGDDI